MTYIAPMVDKILEVLLIFESEKNINREEMRIMLMSHSIQTIEKCYYFYVKAGYIL